MLTPERHQAILAYLNNNRVASVHELVEQTAASESTIRRDLVQLDEQQLLKRVHGGAQLFDTRAEEPTVDQKQSRHMSAKKAIAKHTARFVESGDCIYLDAGTTIFEMIDELPANITVVTNSLSVIDRLSSLGVHAYVTGGRIKRKTKALIGRAAVESLKMYRFDKCFIGMNGIHLEHGFTTPDPEEAYMKQTAMDCSGQSFVLSDHSKLGHVSFSFVNSIDQALIITDDHANEQTISSYKTQTRLEVVPT